MKPKKQQPLRRGKREPTVNPTEQRKRFLALATQLRTGTPLTQDQTRYLTDAFERIGNGENADEVLHLKRRKGQSTTAEQRRRTMSLVFAQVAHYIAPKEGRPPGEGLALQEAMERVAPLAKGLFGKHEDPDSYSVEYLLKCWHDSSYAHMKTTLRTPLDPDSPFGVSK